MASKNNPNPAAMARQQGGTVKGINPRVDDPINRTQAQNAIKELDPKNFFSPQQPIQPYGPPNVTQPRWYDYISGYNINYGPRQFEPISFAQLRGMANSFGLLRTLIQTRKDQLTRIPWDIQILGKPRGKFDTTPVDPRIVYLKQFFKKPDRQTRWHAWCRLLFDDLFVCDAATLYIQPSQAGIPYAISVIDGATITPKIDDFGRRPEPPSPAYQQIIKGLPIVDLTADEIIYAPMNLRPDHRPYGYSPVEQVYLEIMQGIRRELYQLDYWTQGTIPDLIVTVPKEWTPSQTAEFQATFDFLLQGNTALKSKVRFLPGDSKPFEIKGPNLKNDYDEWIARILCFAFSIPPSAFVKMMNRGTAETAQETALAEGLLPLMAWFKDEIMDPIIQEHFGWTDIEFVFTQEEQLDQLKEMQTVTGYVSKGLMTPDEGRSKIGQPPKGGVADELVIITASGATKLEDAVAMASQQVQFAANNEQRTQESHDQQMSQSDDENQRASEIHDREMKTPIPKPATKTKKLDGPDVKKKSSEPFISVDPKNLRPAVKPSANWLRY